jgi:hypothetical protein
MQLWNLIKLFRAVLIELIKSCEVAVNMEVNKSCKFNEVTFACGCNLYYEQSLKNSL